MSCHSVVLSSLEQYCRLQVVNTFKCQNDPLKPTPKYTIQLIHLLLFSVFFYMPSRELLVNSSITAISSIQQEDAA